MSSTSTKAPEVTRRRILDAAFAEIYRNGFQGAGLNQILALAGATKGALFYHFDSKQDLGYAVVDEIVGPLLRARWLDPLEGSTDPVTELQRAFRRYTQADIDSGSWLQGCPLNNLAQEMSPLDAGFHERINALYATWRGRIASALARGAEAGTVRRDVVPEKVAALVVGAQMGIWGSGKSSQSKEVMLEATEALCDHLQTLRLTVRLEERL
jgi:TetR/AcrR family transcriptional repressor of nem operon